MDAFQGAGRPQQRTLLHLEHAAGLDDEIGSHSLARPQGGIAHGLRKASFGTVGPGQKFVEGDRDQVCGLGHAALDLRGHQLNSAGSVPGVP